MQARLLLLLSLSIAMTIAACSENASLGPDPADSTSPVCQTGTTSYSAKADQTFWLGAAAVDSESAVVRYQWDFDGDGVYDWESSKTGNVQYAYPEAGTYTAVFKATNEAGLADSVFVPVTIAALVGPVADAGGPYAAKTYLAGSAVEPPPLKMVGAGTDADGSIALYEWDLDGDGVYDAQSTVTGKLIRLWETPGTFTVVLRVTDSDGLTDTAQTVVTVNPMVPPVADAGGPYTGPVAKDVNDAEAYVMLNGGGTDADGDIVLYEWDLGADGVYERQNTNYGMWPLPFTHAGEYVAVLRVTDSDGLTATATTTITVAPATE